MNENGAKKTGWEYYMDCLLQGRMWMPGECSKWGTNGSQSNETRRRNWALHHMWDDLREGVKMATICTHEFEREDPKNPGYSLIEYDLHAKLGMSIRKNLLRNRYEIFTISNQVVQFAYADLQTIVVVANTLEGGENTKIECGIGCPLKATPK